MATNGNAGTLLQAGQVTVHSPKQAEIQALVLSLTLSESLGPFWMMLQRDGLGVGGGGTADETRSAVMN